MSISEIAAPGSAEGPRAHALADQAAATKERVASNQEILTLADAVLLRGLGFARRRGLLRIAIEDALRTHTARICGELGLDPFEFTLACIPFDAYSRLAARHDWGRSQLWTHFDGYQVTRELDLIALVGGDARYGGPGELCAVQRDYGSAKITARFCVLRRERFLSENRASDSEREVRE